MMNKLKTFLFILVFWGNNLSLASADILSELIENTQQETKTYLYNFSDPTSDSSIDSRRSHALTTLETSSGVKLGDQSYFNIDLLFYLHSMEDNHDDTLHSFERNNQYAAVFAPKILNIVYEADDFDFTMGLDLVDFGYAELHNSVSNFGRANALHPTHNYDLGVLLGRYRRYFGDDILGYTMMPIEIVSLVPTKSNRWRGSGDVYESLPDGSSVSSLEAEPLAIHTNNIRHLVNYEAVRSGYDYYLFGALGPSPFSVIRIKDSLYENYQPWSWQVGGGINTIYGPHKIYSDIMYQFTAHQNDENFIRGTFGGVFKNSTWTKKLGINQITLTTEYARDEKTRDQSTRSDLIYSSKNSRSGLNTIFARVELDIDDTWKVISGVNYNLEDSDNSKVLGLRYKVNDSLEFFSAGTWFDGVDSTLFGVQRDNDTIEFGIKKSL
jgi:hypothetical protein|tara:strand:- start:2214 stop:3530 length:1317 start_codon:yes stop_codon:yes gene_type:complete